MYHVFGVVIIFVLIITQQTANTRTGICDIVHIRLTSFATAWGASGQGNSSGQGRLGWPTAAHSARVNANSQSTLGSYRESFVVRDLPSFIGCRRRRWGTTDDISIHVLITSSSPDAEEGRISRNNGQSYVEGPGVP